MLTGNFCVQNASENAMLSRHRIRNGAVLGLKCQQVHTSKTSGKVRQIVISFPAYLFYNCIHHYTVARDGKQTDGLLRLEVVSLTGRHALHFQDKFSYHLKTLIRARYNLNIAKAWRTLFSIVQPPLH